jgi:hypothetical protein
MDAATALRRAVARAITRPDFDPTGIEDIEGLRKELKRYCPEFFVEEPEDEAEDKADG